MYSDSSFNSSSESCGNPDICGPSRFLPGAFIQLLKPVSLPVYIETISVTGRPTNFSFCL